MFSLLAASNFGKALNSIAHPAVMAAASRPPAKFHNRFLVYTASRNKKIVFKKDSFLNATATYLEDVSGQHEGQFAQTDENVHTQHPPNSEMPPQPIVQGRGGMHFNRTLAHFSLEKKVSMEAAEEQAGKLVEQFSKENPGLEDMPKSTAHYAVVANPDSVSETISKVLDKNMQIDNLVTSAGFTENFDAISYPFDRMQKLWGVNRKAPGNIFMIGSMSGSIVNVPQPQAPYNAAKAAVRHLAVSLAVGTQKILDENPQLRESWTSLIPVGKMVPLKTSWVPPPSSSVTPPSISITGANLLVEGGYTLT
ncbi:Glucose/ribitol dehydrogenase [Penicillium canescens]|nr:Glucose/ribitol dehydrogenase [Penicillium canescens]